jgi:hypothetical protein
VLDFQRLLVCVDGRNLPANIPPPDLTDVTSLIVQIKDPTWNFGPDAQLAVIQLPVNSIDFVNT